MGLGKKDLQVPISQDLLKRVLPLLDSSEDVSVLLEKLLEQEIEKRLDADLNQSLNQPETGDGFVFPEISNELPLKPQYSDLKHIDRQEVVGLLGSCEYLDKTSIDKIPKELQALLEYDIMSSHWCPREGWEELLNDYLDNGSHTSLDSWIEVRKKNQMEDEAAMWVELSRRSLDDY